MFIIVETPYESENLSIHSSDEDIEPLRCWECNIYFTTRDNLHQHLLCHVKQPIVILTRLKTAPIKITLKSTSKDSFEVVSSPATSPLVSPTQSFKLEEPEHEEAENSKETEETNISFSPNYVNGVESPAVNSENSNSSTMNPNDQALQGSEEYNNVPGAEPTPPPEPSPEYPKIRIKTTGLLRDSLTITEITNDNTGGEPTQPEMIELSSKNDSMQSSSNYGSSHCDDGNIWTSASLEDPLRIPESSEKDDGNLLSLFSDNNDRVKDLGFTSSDSEFISLDRLDDRNKNALVSIIA